MATSESCAICAGPRSEFARAIVLAKYEVAYCRCGRCGFIQTEKPYWLEEAYSEAIAGTDIGLVGRNISFAATTQATIQLMFNPDGRFLDYGGGYGLLVRMMRDSGFDFYREDPFCENLFARGFDREDDGPFELITAFEVLEHLPDPLPTLSEMLKLSDNVLCSTLLVPDPPPPPDRWWYYMLDTGQHVSLFTAVALAEIARRLGVSVTSSPGGDLHLFTRNTDGSRFRFLTRPKVARLLNAARRRRTSLLGSDYERVAGRRLV